MSISSHPRPDSADIAKAALGSTAVRNRKRPEETTAPGSPDRGPTAPRKEGSPGRRLFLIAALAALVVAGIAVGLNRSSGEVDRSVTGMNWHAQQTDLGNVGPVPQGTASIERTEDGFTYQVDAALLVPGNAYTLWVVVVDQPGACEGTPCAGPDILLNEATDSQVGYGTGLVAPDSGRATFDGSVQIGELDGWYANRVFENPGTAEIHLVLNDHGPDIPEMRAEMISTYRGGCSDASPFPPPFPETALADGASGPNTCRLYQTGVFATRAPAASSTAPVVADPKDTRPTPDLAPTAGSADATAVPATVSILPDAGTRQETDAPDEFAETERPPDYNINVLQIEVGETVTWTNDDPNGVHTVTAVDGSFDSGRLAHGERWSHTFTEAGEFEYRCSPHPWMRAKVIVEA